MASTVRDDDWTAELAIIVSNMMLVNVKLDISGCNRNTFQGRRIHWCYSFLMAELKRSWQYWHSCIGKICTVCSGL